MQSPVLNGPRKRSATATLRFRALQLRGKVRRFVRANLHTRPNEALLEQRRGECTRCGACCKILLRCPFLDEADGEYSCRIHGKHFAQCQLYPIEPKDLLEVDEDCGYYFESN